MRDPSPRTDRSAIDVKCEGEHHQDKGFGSIDKGKHSQVVYETNHVDLRFWLNAVCEYKKEFHPQLLLVQIRDPVLFWGTVLPASHKLKKRLEHNHNFHFVSYIGRFPPTVCAVVNKSCLCEISFITLHSALQSFLSDIASCHSSSLKDVVWGRGRIHYISMWIRIRGCIQELFSLYLTLGAFALFFFFSQRVFHGSQ